MSYCIASNYSLNKAIVNKFIMGGIRKINSNGVLEYFVVYGLIRFQFYFTIVSCVTVFMQIIKKIGNIVLLLFF
jgi:hypothetical protein